MLCERCQTQEATIHATLLVGTSGESTSHDFCSSCYPEVEAERLRNYNAPSSATPVPRVDVERITALEYLDAAARAERNGDDKPEFRRINQEMIRLPSVQQRLAFEMFPMVWESLERGTDPNVRAIYFVCFARIVEPQWLSEYVQWIEKITHRSFELWGNRPTPFSSLGPFVLTFTSTIAALRRNDRARFTKIVDALKRQCKQGDPRLEAIARIETGISKAEQEGF